MNRKSILDRVYTKTYYTGESRKQETPSAAVIQASSDNNDALNDYLDEAMNEIEFYAHKRLVEISFKDDVLTVESKRPKKDELVSCLDRLLEDYLVEYISYKWFSENGFQTDPSGMNGSLDRLKNCICALAPRVRRRATNMGI